MIFRLCYYIVFVIMLLFFKRKFHIEVEKPHQIISLLYLIPFLAPCFVDLTYCIVYEADFNEAFAGEILGLELSIDFFDSIFEDIVFVDVMIAFLFEIIHNKKKRNLKSMLLSSLFFTLIRSYVFLYNEIGYSFFLLLVTFVVTFACAYLAIYYDSAVIPVVFHLLFNVMNFVVVPLFFSYSIEVEYYLFNSIGLVLLMSYTLFLYHLSDKRYHKIQVENS